MSCFIRIEFHVYLHRGGNNVQVATSKGNNPGISPSKFCQQIMAEADRLKESLSPSTSDNYFTAIRSFQRFLAEKQSLGSLDSSVMKCFERWLRDNRLCLNTISCYMRSLKSLASKVYHKELNGIFDEVYTGRAKTEKRAVQKTEICKIKGAKVKPGSFLALVRDLFLFSFYALGMPFVDMAFLRKEQIADGQIVYYRHKTGQRISIKIEPCMQEIISRYQTKSADYVFPLLTAADPDKAYRQYQQKLNQYNRELKHLAKMSGISKNLTSYVARHSWASAAYDDNVDLPVISKALGHTNPQNTLIYLQQIDDLRIQKANRRLLENMKEFSRMVK